MDLIIICMTIKQQRLGPHAFFSLSLSLSCSMSIPSFLFFVICFFFFYRKGAWMISCWTTHTHGIPFWYRPCPHMQPPAPFPTICDIENEHQLREKKEDKKTPTETLKPGSALQTKNTSSPTVQASIPQTRVIA